MGGHGIEVEGIVVRGTRGDMFEVECMLGSVKRTVLAHPCGRMQIHKIKITAGDRVTVELSEYDTSRGRITYRHR